MASKTIPEAQNPLILRCNRLIEAFAKSDDERDFYLDRREGFIIYVELDKPEEELILLEDELNKNADRYCMIPKLTFYETKKIMEGFINEKVYDIDTKEKLLDIIQSKEARENFLEFIYDHHSELEKWLTYYQERSRIRIIEWLRTNHFHFVFEEDLDIPRLLMEKIKKELFLPKASKDVINARKTLASKAKTYYSNEALNPRPKRGRPPKQIQKAEVEPQITVDIYTTVPQGLRGFLFSPELQGGFSSKFGFGEDLFSGRRMGSGSDTDISAESINQKLAALRDLSSKWVEAETKKKSSNTSKKQDELEFSNEDDFDDFDEEDEDDFEDESPRKSKSKRSSSQKASKTSKHVKTPNKNSTKPAASKTKARQEAAKPKAKAAKSVSAKKALPASNKAGKKPASSATKKKPLRPMMKLKKKS